MGTKPTNPILMRQLNWAMFEADGNGGFIRHLNFTNAYSRVLEGIRLYDQSQGTSFKARFETDATPNGINH